MKYSSLNLKPDYTLKDSLVSNESKPFKFDHLKEMRSLLNAANTADADAEWERYKRTGSYGRKERKKKHIINF